ncbi:MAG: SDR family oxidoreductase, partial [Bacteroidota bacterium]|nr:SDR family oxidoreductase [Bacteroidota bacterium]
SILGADSGKFRIVMNNPGPMLRWSVNQSPDPEAVLREVRQMHLTERIAAPAEVANLILYLASDDAAFITGQAFRIDGGLGLTIPGSKRA